MVLHDGEDNLVALVQEGLAVAGGHQVEALGRAAGKDYLGGTAGVEKGPDALARRLVEVGGLLGEEMHAAVDVGVDGIILVRDGLDHGPRLLGGGGVVEVDERPPVDFAAEDGKVAAHLFYIIHGG